MVTFRVYDGGLADALFSTVSQQSKFGYSVITLLEMYIHTVLSQA